MQRQDTQPVLSDDLDFTSLLQQHPSLMSEHLTFADDLQQSLDKCNDMQLQQQPIEQCQGQLIQLPQQQNQLQQQPYLILGHSQNGQGNIQFSQQMAVGTMKQENMDGPGISRLSSDYLSSTPPEMLRGIPYSEMHTFTSDAVNGSVAHQNSAASGPSASSSSQAFYNQTNAHCADSFMPSAFYSQNSCSSLQNQAYACNSSQFHPIPKNHLVSQIHNTLPGVFHSKSDAMAIVSTRSHSNLASGCTTMRLQKQIEMFQNLPLSQVAELNCPSNNTNNYNMNNNFSTNTHNSYTIPQTQYSCSELLCPPITTLNNQIAAGSTSNCGSSKFPEPSSSIEPSSPATLEASDVIAILTEDKCIPQPVELQRHLIALHDDHEKKFAPRDQKFILPSSSNEIMLKTGGWEGGLGVINTELTRAKTIDVTTLNNWPGDYDFQIKVVPNDKHKNKWCYSSKVHRLYCYPMLAAEVKVSVNDWMKASCHNAEVRLVAVYQDAQNRTKPVHRCHNCKKSDKTSSDLMEHMVQVSNSGAVHSVTGSRYTVSVPMVRSHLGEDSVTLLIRCTCMSSCVGGPNRRPFALLFSLMMNGEEKGRQMLSTKCCKGPNRDIKKDETDHDRQLGLVVENNSNTKPDGPGADCSSPKKANIAIAGSSGLHVALSSPKCSATKRKSAGKKLFIPGELCSSDSETDRSGSKKTKLGNSSGRGTGAVPEGYSNIVIPTEFKNETIKYVEALKALKWFKSSKLNVFKVIDLP